MSQKLGQLFFTITISLAISRFSNLKATLLHSWLIYSIIFKLAWLSSIHHFMINIQDESEGTQTSLLHCPLLITLVGHYSVTVPALLLFLCPSKKLLFLPQSIHLLLALLSLHLVFEVLIFGPWLSSLICYLK